MLGNTGPEQSLFVFLVILPTRNWISWKRCPDTSPTGHFPDRHFPDWHISNWTIPRSKLARLGISPTRHFPERLFPRPDISPSGYLSDCTFPRLHISSSYTYYFWADISLTLNNIFLTGNFWQFKCRKRLNFLVNEW